MTIGDKKVWKASKLNFFDDLCLPPFREHLHMISPQCLTSIHHSDHHLRLSLIRHNPQTMITIMRSRPLLMLLMVVSIIASKLSYAESIDEEFATHRITDKDGHLLSLIHI